MDPLIMKRFAIREYDKTMPISRKAYYKFIDRIYSITGNSVEFEYILDAFECYIYGKPLKREEFSHPSCYLAFEFLRVEVDIAIQRSAAARRRAELRRQAKEKTSEQTATSVKSEVAGQPHMQPSGTPCHTFNDYGPINRSEYNRAMTPQTPVDGVGLSSFPFCPASTDFDV